MISESHTTNTTHIRERERERDDRGRVLRVPLVAPPSLFQPRDGVGFDRYDDDDDDDDHILFNTHTRNVSLSLSFFSFELD